MKISTNILTHLNSTLEDYQNPQKTGLPFLSQDSFSQFFSSSRDIAMRDGVEVEKGVALSQSFVNTHMDLLIRYFEYFTAYPDRYLDFIKPIDSNFSLFFYQRIHLRATFRYVRVFIGAPRGAGKSFTTILAMMLQCIFFPGTKRFICAPNKRQAAQIAKEKIVEIYRQWPLIEKEVSHTGQKRDYPGNFGNDYVTLNFKNGSIFDVVGALDSTRGGRRHGGLIDELRDHDAGPLERIVLPLMAVSRRLPTNRVNPKEPNQQVAYMTSAGSPASYAYSILMDTLADSIASPRSSFVMGFDYRVPLAHGLLDATALNSMKTSSSYSEEAFLSEYLNIWTGAVEESWIDEDRLNRYRKLKNPEWKAKSLPDSKFFYLLAVDVGRLQAQTVCTVFRVNPREAAFFSTTVNIFVLGRQGETKPFSEQAIELKQIIADFDPVEVVIDLTGLGMGLGDEMIKTQVTPEGKTYPPYAFMNDEDYIKIQPKDAPRILYGLKANRNLNIQIDKNVVTTVMAGRVRFLIKEQEARSHLLSTKVGQKMSPQNRVKRLIPHEMTTALFREMGNLRWKVVSGQSESTLERISERYPKDKYSSFSYGLWRIRERENQEIEKRGRRRKPYSIKELVFFD